MSELSAERWKLIAPLLDQGLDLSAAERADWLASLRAQDAALASDLQALLEEHGTVVAKGFLEQLPETLTDRPDSLQPLTNRTLGEFVLLEMVGAGGFGDVYLAEQPALGRQAVVKVLRRDRLNEEGVRRFLREARLASRLDHPYAAHTYAFGAESDGICWIAMELVRGSTLRELLAAQGPISIERFVPLLERITEVVHTAHEQGIVHRDLKPDNIMVISRAGRLLPKLLDLGVARAVDAASAATEAATWGTRGADGPSNDGQTTRSGAVLGSPAYMAPELWTDAHQAGPGADQYALGALTYEALTGRPAFPGGSLLEIEAAHRRGEVAPLGQQFPPALDSALARAFVREPAERYASVLDFAKAVRKAAGMEAPSIEIPLLDDELRLRYLTGAPQPLAEAVAAYGAARNAHQAREALRALARTAAWFIGIVATACRSRVGPGGAPDTDQARSLLRDLRRQGLGPAGWIALARQFTLPFLRLPDTFPIPELVPLLHPGSDALDPLSACLEGSLFDPLSDSTDEAASQAIQRELPAVTALLGALRSLLDYRLIVARSGHWEEWTGTRRGPWPVMPARREILPGRVALVDRDCAPLLALWPLVQIVAPMPGQPEEVFMLAGPGREAARLVSAPRGFEHQDPVVWEWFRSHLLAGEDSNGSASSEVSPYRGLAAYTVDDSGWFFGRERETEVVVNRFRVEPFVAVVGPSGVGKSSFVNAGVAASMQGWHLVTLRPGRSPMAQLEQALREASQVRQSDRTSGVLIVVDQFEELFTLGCSVEERARFARALLAASPSAAEPVRILITLRDDFLIQAEQLPGMSHALAHGLQLLGPLGSAALEYVLIEPARRVGYTYEDSSLPSRMVATVEGTPAAVALISFMAASLWELRDRHFHQLPTRAYQAMGGVAGALARHADETVDSMPPAERGLVRKAFRHLVTSEGTRAVLSRTELQQLLGGGPEPRRLIERLIAARLLASAEDEQGGALIEIVHEALLTSWPRLVQWRREDAEGSRFQEQLRAAARQWEDRSRPRGLLWRGDALSEYQVWRRRHAGNLTPLEQAFASASQSDAARGRTIRRTVVAVMAMVAAVFSVVLWRAYRAERRSRDQTVTLLRDSTFEQGRLLALRDDKQGALQQLRRAFQMGEQGPANRLMIGETSRNERARRFVLKGQGAFWASAYSSDDKLIATSSDDWMIRIWDADTGALKDTFRHSGGVHRLAFSPDRKYLAVIDRAGVRLWDVAGRRQAALLELPHGYVPGEGAGWVGFDHRSELLLATTDQGRARVWQLTSLNKSKSLAGLTGMVIGKFCPMADCLVTIDGYTDTGETTSQSPRGQVVIWDSRTLKPIGRYRHRSSLIVSAIARTGATIAVGSDAGELVLLRQDGSVIARRQAHAGSMHDMMFSPDGTLVATAGRDHFARLWNARTAEPRGELVGHGANVTGVSFSPAGDLIATTGIDGLIRIWSTTGTLLGKLEGHTEAAINEPAFRSDGKQMVTTSWDGSAIVWDLAAARQFESIPTARAHFFVEGKVAYNAVAFSPDGQRVAVLVDGGLWISQAGSPTEGCQAREGHPMTDLAWSPDGAHLATVSDAEPLIRLWNTRSCKLERMLVGLKTARPVFLMMKSLLAFGPRGQLATVLDRQTAGVWDARTGSLTTLDGYSSAPINDLGFTPDGRLYVTRVGTDGQGEACVFTTINPAGAGCVRPAEIVVHDLRGGSQKIYRDKSPFLSSVAFDRRRGRLLATGLPPEEQSGLSMSKGSVWIWNERTGALIDRLVGEYMSDIYLSPDSSLIIGIGGRSPTVWDAETRTRLGALEGHEGSVYEAGFLTGDLFMTASQDRTARVWDLAARRLLLVLPGAMSVAFNRESTSVVLLSNTSTRLWRPSFAAGPGLASRN